MTANPSTIHGVPVDAAGRHVASPACACRPVLCTDLLEPARIVYAHRHNPPGPPDPEPEEDGIFLSAPERHAAEADRIARRWFDSMTAARFSDLSAFVQTNLLKPTTDRRDADHNPWYRTPMPLLGVGRTALSVCFHDPCARPVSVNVAPDESVFGRGR